MLTLLIALLANPTATAGCEQVAGIERLAADRDMQWLVLGEQHGTSEMPKAFADVVCGLARKRKRIVVGIEYPAEEQQRIDAFIASDGGKAATEALLASGMWRATMQDGRASEAFLRLIERLRQFRQQKLIERVVAIQPSWPGSSAAYERAMASQLIEVRKQSPSALVAVLVGNMHARNSKAENAKTAPMASFLPPASTRTINMIADGGAQWGCFVDAASGGNQPVCGKRDNAKVSVPYTIGISLVSPPPQYNGVFYIGRPTTSSAPAVASLVTRD